MAKKRKSSRKKTVKRKAVRRKVKRVAKRKVKKSKKRAVKRKTKKVVKRKKPNDKYRLEPIVIRMPRKNAHRTEAILICPKCKSENIRIVDYQGIRCVVCRDCKFDERNIYDVSYTERKAPKVKATFKAGGHLRTIKRK